MDLFNLSVLYCERCINQSGCLCLLNNPSFIAQITAFHTSLQRNGFVQIYDHGIEQAVLFEAANESKLFFDKSYNDKKLTITKDKARRGYSPSSSENFASLIGQANIPNDQVEKYRIGPMVSEHEKDENQGYYNSKEGRIHFFPNNEEELEVNFCVVTSEYYPAMERLCKKIMKIICYCEGLPVDYFEPITDKHTSILSLNYFGPNVCGVSTESCEEDQPFIRIAEHTDVSLLTVVAQTADLGEQYGGLEVLIRDDDGNESYKRVPYIHGAVVVNVGDCLHDWSEGRYKSAMHRVVSYPQKFAILEKKAGAKDNEALRAAHSRYSMAFFFAPNYDAEMHWPVDCAEAGDIITKRSKLTYSSWRKNHIKKSMQQLKKSTGNS